MPSSEQVLPRNSTIESLQGGRAIAALAVVVHHGSLAARDFGHPFPGQWWLSLGYLGVDFFFVLSGFIIYHSTVARSKTPRTYAAARFKRVYLPYLPIGIGIALLYVLLPGISAGDHRWAWLPTMTLAPVGNPALTVAWTLQHEITFYAIFGLGFFLGELPLVLCLWGAAILADYALLKTGFIPLRLINLEFLFGVAVAAWRDRTVPPLWLALVPLICWFLLGAEREESVLFGLFCALLIWLLVRAEAAGRFRVPNWLLFLGAASYAIYLCHGLAISIVARLLPGVPHLIFPVAVVVGMTAGIAYYLAIERPLLALAASRRLRSALFPRPVA